MGAILGVIAAIAYGANNVAIKKTSTQMPLLAGIFYSGWLPAIVSAMVVGILLITNQMLPWNTLALFMFILQGIFGAFIGRICLFKGIHHVGAARTSQLYATQPVITAVIAARFLGEVLQPLGYLGMAAVILGVFLLFHEINPGHHPKTEPLPAELAIKPKKNPHVFRGFLFGLGAAFFYGFASVFGKFGLNLMPSPFLLSLITAVIPLIISLAVLAPRGKFSEIKQQEYFLQSRKYYNLAGLFLTIGLFSYFGALNALPASTIATLQSTTPLFSILFTALFLKGKEAISWKTLVSALIIMGGVALLLLA